MKPVTMYCISDGKNLYTYTVRQLRRDAIDLFCENMGMAWYELKRDGYRCMKGKWIPDNE